MKDIGTAARVQRVGFFPTLKAYSLNPNPFGILFDVLLGHFQRWAPLGGGGLGCSMPALHGPIWGPQIRGPFKTVYRGYMGVYRV